MEMGNPDSEGVEAFAGLDVGAREIVAARRGNEETTAPMTRFANHATGHRALLAFLLHGNERVRVCLEASGNSSIDVALVLHAHRRLEVSMVNPRRARHFAESLGERSKTDPVDARVLCQYAARMPWEPWRPPSRAALQLRAITRAIADLVVMHTQEKNREHALKASQALPALLLRERRRHQRYLELRIQQLRREARRLIARDPELDRRFRLMLTVPGVADTSALHILGELAVLPESLDARQWVAFSGLDPSLFTSGTSVEKRPRISRGFSRHLRHALDMPVLVALQHEPHLRAFYHRLVRRGQARMQAVIGVMRKLLHGLFAMFRSNQSYDGAKRCGVPASQVVVACA
jgi:transposase